MNKNLSFSCNKVLRLTIGMAFVLFSFGVHAQSWINNSAVTNPCDNVCICDSGWSLGTPIANCTYQLEGNALYNPAEGCLYNNGQNCGPCGQNGTASLEGVSCWSGSQFNPVLGASQIRCSDNSQCIGGPNTGGYPRDNEIFIIDFNTSGKWITVN